MSEQRNDSLELLVLEFGRSFTLITNILSKITNNTENTSTDVVKLQEAMDKIEDILTNDNDGLRKQIREIKDNKLLKFQNKLNLRSTWVSILVPLLTTLIGLLGGYFLAK